MRRKRRAIQNVSQRSSKYSKKLKSCREELEGIQNDSTEEFSNVNWNANLFWLLITQLGMTRCSVH